MAATFSSANPSERAGDSPGRESLIFAFITKIV